MSYIFTYVVYTSLLKLLKFIPRILMTVHNMCPIGQLYALYSPTDPFLSHTPRKN